MIDIAVMIGYLLPVIPLPVSPEGQMASNTTETRFRRKIRRKKMGKARKTKLQNNGTTPKFDIHTPEADQNAPNQVSPKQQ